MSIPVLKRKQLNKSYILAKSVTGQCLDTVGTLTVSIRLGDNVFTHNVQVVRNTSQPMILGWDFLYTQMYLVPMTMIMAVQMLSNILLEQEKQHPFAREPIEHHHG